LTRAHLESAKSSHSPPRRAVAIVGGLKNALKKLSIAVQKKLVLIWNNGLLLFYPEAAV
jgi:hypothetical protein